MDSDKSFIILPRSFFRSDTWLKASLDERGAMASLFAMVAYNEFDYDSDWHGKIHLQRGQMVTSQRGLADIWRYGEKNKNRAQKMVNALVKKGFMSSEVVKGGSDQSSDQSYGQYTLLSINMLNGSVDHGRGRNSGRLNNKNINNKNTNTPKSPSGTDSSFVFSSEKDSEFMLKVRKLNSRLAAAWKKIFDEGRWTGDLRAYTPFMYRSLVTRDSQIDEIRRNTCIPVMKSINGKEAFFLMEFHLTNLIVVLGLTHKLSEKDVGNLATELVEKAADLTLAQVALFFHFMFCNNPVVESLHMKGTVTAEMIREAFGKYIVWLKS